MDTPNEAPPALAQGPGKWMREITPAKAQRFLEELANLVEPNPNNVERFLRAFGTWCASLSGLMLEQTPEGYHPRNMESSLSVGAVLMPGVPILSPMLSLGEILRSAWRQPRRLEREMGIIGMFMELSNLHREARNQSKATPETPIPFVLLEALHVADRMRVCGNPTCKNPYFLAVRRTQKYCSEPCARPAQREFKRAWWDSEKGRKWREMQKARPHRKGKKSTKKGATQR